VDVATRERDYVRVSGPDALTHLQNVVSNDVAALQPGAACPALLLTPKARVIAPVVVLRRGDDDFLVLTERGLGETVRAHLTRLRMRLRCEIELESHSSALVFGGDGFVPMTAMEYDLLRIFLANPNRVLSRDQLLDMAHSKEMEAFDRSIDTRITRLRQKIEVEPSAPQAIRTVRGAGYVFVPAGGDFHG